MLIIGEKINGTLKKTAAAIAARDVSFIQDLARRQVEAGADYLDVNAGTVPSREPDVPYQIFLKKEEENEKTRKQSRQQEHWN